MFKAFDDREHTACKGLTSIIATHIEPDMMQAPVRQQFFEAAGVWCILMGLLLLQTMQAAKATPGILKMCGSQKLLDQLTECNKLLESVQKVGPPTLGHLRSFLYLLFSIVEGDASIAACAAFILLGTWQVTGEFTQHARYQAE